MALPTTSQPLGQWIANNIGFTPGEGEGGPSQQYIWNPGGGLANGLYDFGASSSNPPLVSDYTKPLGGKSPEDFFADPSWAEKGVSYKGGNVFFPQEKDKGFFGDFMDFAQIPLTFLALATGAGQFPGAPIGDGGLGELGINTALEQQMAELGANASGFGTMEAGSALNPEMSSSFWDAAKMSAPAGSGSSIWDLAKSIPASSNSDLSSLAQLASGTPLDFSANPDFGLTSGGGGTFGPGSPMVNAASGALGPTSGWEDLLRKLKAMKSGPLGTALNVGSGLYGLLQSANMAKLGKAAMERSDPFGPYRSGYAQQLNSLMLNPSSINKYPGYQAGIDAVTRKMASQGYLGSGNMMAALQKYGGDFFNTEAARLAGLAGANFQPDSRAALAGSAASADLASKALASLGYAASNYALQ